MVDPQKLARFFQQLNTIQAKIARLQAERTANALREDRLRVRAPLCQIYNSLIRMSCTLMNCLLLTVTRPKGRVDLMLLVPGA